MAKATDYRQRSLVLKVVIREPTMEEMRAAYELCVADKSRLPFEKALEDRPISLILKNQARRIVFRKGGK